MSESTGAESIGAPPTRATRYGVLLGDVDTEIEIKRSRFLCSLVRVEHEDEARDAIELVRMEHRLARHHCTAFVLGADRMQQRSNDDGEPSGTAGVPMLEALTRFVRPGAAEPDLSDVVAIVVRYFGGVLLGAGGLVRAYSDAVSTALLAGRFATRQRVRRFRLALPHAEAGRAEHELRAVGVTVLGTDYAADAAALVLAIDDEQRAHDELAARIAVLTQGTGELVDAGVDWVDVR